MGKVHLGTTSVVNLIRPMRTKLANRTRLGSYCLLRISSAKNKTSCRCQTQKKTKCCFMRVDRDLLQLSVELEGGVDRPDPVARQIQLPDGRVQGDGDHLENGNILNWKMPNRSSGQKNAQQVTMSSDAIFILIVFRKRMYHNHDPLQKNMCVIVTSRSDCGGHLTVAPLSPALTQSQCCGQKPLLGTTDRHSSSSNGIVFGSGGVIFSSTTQFQHYF